MTQEWPKVRTWFGVQYPDMKRTVRVTSEADARGMAEAYPGAIAVTSAVGDWLPIGAGAPNPIRDILQAYSEWLEDEGAMVGIHLEPRAHDELIADFFASLPPANPA